MSEKEAPRRLQPPCAAVQALVIAARRNFLLDDLGLQQFGKRAVRSGARTPAELLRWMRDSGVCTPRLFGRMEALLPHFLTVTSMTSPCCVNVDTLAFSQTRVNIVDTSQGLAI